MNKNLTIEEGTVLTEDYIGESIVPVGTKIDCYINLDGVNSETDNGFSEYYIIDKEITMRELVNLMESTHTAKFSNDTMELVVDSDYENEYTKISSLLK